jgi:hypothetical protein
VFAVPFNFLGGLTIEDKANWELAVLPDLASDVVTMLELVNETFAGVVKEEATDTTESLSSQKLDLGVGLLGIDEASGVDLDLLKIDSIGTNLKSNLMSITG